MPLHLQHAPIHPINNTMKKGNRFKSWIPASGVSPSSFRELQRIIQDARGFKPVERLEYGDHGLLNVLEAIADAIVDNKRIALYADYDVDGTMSCVSWIWFFQAIGFKNFVHYIPCRFKEGYGVNLSAVKHLVEQEKADLIITMDTGITANTEAAWCRERGVTFICTDHHKIQSDKMPDCLILNPKMHPEPAYQELCGCGITFVLLRRLALHVPNLIKDPNIWTDILALTGMATICDVVPLNGVNHKLAKMGVEALMKSRRPILVKLRSAAQISETDEKDVGFKLGPRINAVGRLEHAHLIIRAFIEEDPTDLIAFMNSANERRRQIQSTIVEEARGLSSDSGQSPILFLGGSWHPGVVGIAASKLAEENWKPTWLFERKDGICKGSARSIPGFDVTDAMLSCSDLFIKCGGHAAAGGFSFEEKNEAAIRKQLEKYALIFKQEKPEVWQSSITYDCKLAENFLTLEIMETLEGLKPYGHHFEEPRFCITGRTIKVDYYLDKQTGRKKHTYFLIKAGNNTHKVLFFNCVIESVEIGETYSFIVSVSKNSFRGSLSLSITGHDWAREHNAQ